MKIIKGPSSFLLLVFLVFFKVSYGQQVPLNPVSYRIFSPFVLNPAIAGSKDFSSIDFISGLQGKSNSQMLAFNSRLSTKEPGYFMSPNIKKFSRLGIGGSLFNEKNAPSQNIGLSAACSYQIPLEQQSLSFLSFGIAAKGILNIMDSVTYSDPALTIPGKKLFYANLDLGFYYYGPKLFAGLSVTNLLGNPENPDSLGHYRMPVSRQYYFIAGYKIILYEQSDIVLEPSLILNTNGSRNQKIIDIFKPMVKLYMQGFCFGTYFNNYDNISFFFQQKFPGFYFGTFFEIPRNLPYYKKALNIEFTLGLNYSTIKSKNHKNYHW